MGKQTVCFDYVIKNIGQLDSVKDLTLVRGYHQIFEQYPGLHPDGFDDPESGWPEDIKPICSEMWRRAESPASSIKPDQMYYINKAFRKLMADSAAQLTGKHTFYKVRAVQA
jgi:hypothetical protein